MKKLTVIVAAFLIAACANETKAQTSKEVRKEVNLEDNNGMKVLTITTTENGNTTTEVYKGAEADAKIQEFSEEKSGTTKTIVIGDDGKQHMKVETKVVIKEEKTEDE